MDKIRTRGPLNYSPRSSRLRHRQHPSITSPRAEIYYILLQHLDAYKSNKAKRQQFRETLVKVIIGAEEQLNTLQREVSAGWRPESELTKARRRMMKRYKVYVERGMDCSSVAPIERSWIEHIIRFLPQRLKARKAFLVELIKELQEEYLVTIHLDFNFSFWNIFQDIITTFCTAAEYEESSRGFRVGRRSMERKRIDLWC